MESFLARIRDWNLKEELELYANANNTVIFGANSIYHTIKPGEISVTSNTGTVTQGLQDQVFGSTTLSMQTIHGK